MTMSYHHNNMDAKHAVTYMGTGAHHPSGAHAHQYHENMGHVATHDVNVNSVMSQFQAMSLPSSGMPHNGNGMGQMAPGPAYMLSHDGQFVLAPVPAAGHAIGMDHMGQNGFSHGGPYLTAPGQFSPYVPYPMIPFTPGRAGAFQDRTHRGHNDVPGLENRRGSYSTTESTPATPFYNGIAKHDNGPRVAVVDRSTYTTPSPQQLGLAHMLADPNNKHNGKHNVIAIPVDRNLEEILKQEPAVPKAVPAVFTPSAQMKSLDQSLENRIPGNRNVYIRGLHPTTDDELLYKFAARFGEVETSKAIIDTSTGACKGFGFAKFYDVRDSEMCIRGFHRLGYEVGFARESFNSRLKAEGDDGSTNLYISNLPKSLTEVELGAIFLGYTIMSSKILRDSMGNSRGVGFARFEDRDVCDDVIKKYNGLGIGDEGLLMNIRYADTPAQKELKRITAERRQFRTNEYNIGAYGTPLVGLQSNMYHQPAWKTARALPPSPNVYASRNGLNRLGQMIKSEGYAGKLNQQPTPEATVASPSSEASDEGVTIHAESSAVIASTQSSPSVKKEQK